MPETTLDAVLMERLKKWISQQRCDLLTHDDYLALGGERLSGFSKETIATRKELLRLEAQNNNTLPFLAQLMSRQQADGSAGALSDDSAGELVIDSRLIQRSDEPLKPDAIIHEAALTRYIEAKSVLSNKSEISSEDSNAAKTQSPLAAMFDVLLDQISEQDALKEDLTQVVAEKTQLETSAHKKLSKLRLKARLLPQQLAFLNTQFKHLEADYSDDYKEDIERQASDIRDLEEEIAALPKEIEDAQRKLEKAIDAQLLANLALIDCASGKAKHQLTRMLEQQLVLCAKSPESEEVRQLFKNTAFKEQLPPIAKVTFDGLAKEARQATSHVALMIKKFEPKPKRIDILSTDPGEDVDDWPAIIVKVITWLNNPSRKEADLLRIITNNEVTDDCGRGLRAMAVSELLHQLTEGTINENIDLDTLDVDDRKKINDIIESEEQRKKLSDALKSGKLSIHQGKTNQQFMQDRQTGGDKHFYCESLVKAYYKRNTSQPRFKTVEACRQELGDIKQQMDEQPPAIHMDSIGSHCDIAALIFGQHSALNLLKYNKKPFGLTLPKKPKKPATPEEEEKFLEEKKTFLTNYAARMEHAYKSLSENKDDLRDWLLANTKLSQMTGGFQEPEFNDSIYPVASLVLNHAFKGENHVITPWDITQFAPEIGRDLRGEEGEDCVTMASSLLESIFREQLVGVGGEKAKPVLGHSFLGKRPGCTMASQHHDLLSLFFATQKTETIHCRMLYFLTERGHLSQRYEYFDSEEACKQATSEEGVYSEPFTANVDPLTLDLLKNPIVLDEKGKIKNEDKPRVNEYKTTLRIICDQMIRDACPGIDNHCDASNSASISP